MDERIRRLVSASLAVALAVSCYPVGVLAFAEDNTAPLPGAEPLPLYGGAAYAAQEENAESGGDRAGNEPVEGAGQPASNGADEGTAVERVGADPDEEEAAAYDLQAQPLTALISGDSGIMPLAVSSYSVIDTLVASAWTGTGTQFVVNDNAASPVKWSSSNGTLFWLVSMLVDLADEQYRYLVDPNNTYNNYLKGIDSNTSNISSKSNSIYPQVVSMRADMLTVKSILMESLGDISAGSGVTAFSFGGVSWSATQGTISWLLSVIQMNLSGIYDNSEVANTRLQSIITSNSGILTVQGQIRDYLKSIFERDGYTWSAWTLSDIAERIRLNTVDLIESNETANTVLRTNLGNINNTGTAILGKVSQLLLEVEGISVPDYSDEYTRINSSLALIRGAVRPGSNPYEVAYADYTLWDWLYTLHKDMGELSESAVNLVKILSSFFMVDGKSYTAADFVGSGSDVDLSEVNKLLGRIAADLASIRDKYVIDDALNTLVNGLVGDLKLSAPAAVGQIQTAMSAAFPFCIPSVVNEVLFGSLVADGAAPIWEFDIDGSPLVVDFADFDPLAEVSRWTVRLLFIAALLLNTRRFVYGLDEV